MLFQSNDLRRCFFLFKFFLYREKQGDPTQTYDKKPKNNRNFENQ